MSESIFSWVAVRRWGIEDPLCVMNAYHIDVFDQLGFFDSYKSIGTELSIFAANQNIKIAQQHVKIRGRQDGPRLGGRIFTNMVILRSLWIGSRNIEPRLVE